MLDVIIFFFPFVLTQVKKTTACSIVVAYVGRYNPQFIDFRVFKVLFRLVLKFVLQVFLFLFTGCGHHRFCVGNARRHNDNQHFGVVFVSSL